MNNGFNINNNNELLQHYGEFMNDEEEKEFLESLYKDTEPPALVSRLFSLSDEIIEIVDKKNKDYGNSFTKSVDEFGQVIYAIRLDDKINRLKTLIKANKIEVNESLRDTLLDIVGYGLLILDDMEQRSEDI